MMEVMGEGSDDYTNGEDMTWSHQTNKPISPYHMGFAGSSLYTSKLEFTSKTWKRRETSTDAHVSHNAACPPLGVSRSVPQPPVDHRDNEGERGSVDRVDKHSLEQHVQASARLGGARGRNR
jgi:hypothetical protein